MQAVNYLPQLPQLDCEMDLQDLRWALSKLVTKKARGMDGFSNYELKHLPTALYPFLVALLNLFTRTGIWPQALLRAKMALLHKTTTIGDITSTRPITILASVYRLGQNYDPEVTPACCTIPAKDSFWLGTWEMFGRYGGGGSNKTGEIPPHWTAYLWGQSGLFQSVQHFAT